MNIRTRLRISNLLMILVPAAVAVVVGAGAVAVVWYVLASGVGVGIDDSEDFFDASNAIFRVVEPFVVTGNLEGIDDALALSDLLTASSMELAVIEGGEVLYEYGDGGTGVCDDALVSAALAEGGDVFVSANGRCVSVHEVHDGGRVRDIVVTGQAASGSEKVTNAVILGGVIALLVVLVVTIVLTNRFLTLFVLRHVTEPLDLLAKGAREVSEGNLSVRLPEDRSDEFAPAFAAFNDMTRRLAASVEHDRRREEERRTLVVGLSHDLRSPLTSIQAYAEGLLDGVARTPAARERYVKTILAKADEMHGMMTRLSDAAQFDAFMANAAFEEADVAQLCAEWVEENRGSYALQGIAVELEACTARADVDKGLIERILANLLDNCARYAKGDRDACRVRVSCGPLDAGGAFIAVEDDGDGVEAEERSRLFDLFYRGDEARSSVAEGSGIGLAVVARAAQRMGGEARASASELGGLSIEVTIAEREEGR